MSFTDSLEQKFLFTLTRFLALLIIAGLVISMVVGGIMLGDTLLPQKNTKVTPIEVMEAIKPSVTYNQSQSDQRQESIDVNVLPGIKLPFILQKHFNNPNAIKYLKRLIEDLPSGQRTEFINELAAVVEEAERTNANVPDAINKYAELKLSKIKESQLAEAGAKAQRLTYLGYGFACVGLIAMFSLILVLLAIERNTRRGTV